MTVKILYETQDGELMVCGYIPKCIGCDSLLDNPEKYPIDYPDDMKMCCDCTLTYLWYLGMSPSYIQSIVGNYSLCIDFCKAKWENCGEKIMKVMRIQ